MALTCGEVIMPDEHHSHEHWKGYNYERSDEMKRRYIPPERVINAVQPSTEDIIVDVACGSGFFSFDLAEKAKEMIAIDSNIKATESIRAKIRDSGVDNITVISEDVCKFVPDRGNKVFISNAFHDISCRKSFLDSYTSELHYPQFILIEIKPEAPIGPPGNIKISENQLSDTFSEYGYRLDYSDNLEMHYIHRYTRS